MYKRTLYISEETQSKIDEIASSENKTKAEVLRLAVDTGLKHMTNPQHLPYAEKKPSVITAHEQEENPHSEDDIRTRILRLILK